MTDTTPSALRQGAFVGDVSDAGFAGVLTMGCVDNFLLSPATLRVTMGLFRDV